MLHMHKRMNRHSTELLQLLLPLNVWPSAYLQTEDAQLEPLGLWLRSRLHLLTGHLRLLAQVSWLRRRWKVKYVLKWWKDIKLSWWGITNTFLRFGCLGNMFHDHTLYALLDQRGGSRNQAQLLPALGHLLLHLFIISCTACALDQLKKTPKIYTCVITAI